jgi:hypothetical protein
MATTTPVQTQQKESLPILHKYDADPHTLVIDNGCRMSIPNTMADVFIHLER